MNKILAIFLIIALGASIADAQKSNFDKQREKMHSDFEKSRTKNHSDYENFRKKANDDYAKQLKKMWKKFDLKPGVTRKPMDKVPPVVFDDKDRDEKPTDNPVPIANIITTPTPAPQPEPIAPVEPKPELKYRDLTFKYLHTPLRVRAPQNNALGSHGAGPADLSQAWAMLSDGSYDAMLSDVLALREKHTLPDWAYLNMLLSVAQAMYPNNSNNATMLAAWLYCQSGYAMKLATTGRDIVMLYGTEYIIFNQPYYTFGNLNYFTVGPTPSGMNISTASFPGEKGLSLAMDRLPDVNIAVTLPHTFKSAKYPNLSISPQTNSILLEYFASCPSGKYKGDEMSQWAWRANTPASDEMEETVYPSIRRAIAGKNKLEAVEMILNLIQTSIPYEVDDTAWGRERIFFPDETLYYPACDCEDRAILFTRLVRDLTGLRCALLHYPGHVAAAVEFPNEVAGDYVIAEGRRYTVCDPTILGAGAPVGRSMRAMAGKPVTVGVLK